MRRFILLALLAATPVLAAGDVLPPTPEQQLSAARGEVARATAEEARLTVAASRAADEAQRLAAQQRAVLAAMSATEARIAAAQVELAVANAAIEAQRRRLAERQAPLAGLLAGLVEMGRRPPLLALADGSTEEFVRVRALLDATEPVIRARTAALSRDLAAADRSAADARAARDELGGQRRALAGQRTRFVALEQQALARQTQFAGAALGAGDMGLAGGESLVQLGGEAARRSAGLAVARDLARLGPLPPRPTAPDSRAPRPPLDYRLPVDGVVAAGFGSVDDKGVRARGVTQRAARGAAVIVPATGKILFAGPYRRSDGVVIIDHGGGWRSLLLNVATDLPRGASVRGGDSLGRALGPVEVDLSKNGTYVSPAFMAASSAMLSKARKGS